MNRKILKALKILAIILCIFSLIISFAISQDEHHIECCEKEECEICNMIRVAQSIINISVISIVFVLINICVCLLITLFRKKQFRLLQTSLVYQKVQFNE